MTDFLDEKRREIDDRLRELKSAVEEYNRLEAAASALAGVPGPARASTPSPRRGPGPPGGSGPRPKATGASTSIGANRKKPARPPGRVRAGRRKGSGTRAAQALSFVQGQPGITIPELAAKMGIKRNYLYRVLPALEHEGKVKKQGRGWEPSGP